MIYSQFFATGIRDEGINLYIIDSINHILEMITEDEDESIITALLTINDSGHCYMDQYTDIPIGEEGDRVFLIMENKISIALNRFVNTYIDLMEILIYRNKNNLKTGIHVTPGGILIEYEDI